MLVWLQHTDFTSDEYREATLETAMKQFAAFDWPTELKRLAEAQQLQQEYCDPGIGLVRGDQHILHVCPHSAETGSVFYHYQQPAKVLGLIPYLSSEHLHADGFPLRRIGDLFEAHFSNDHAATMQLLQPYIAD